MSPDNSTNLNHPDLRGVNPGVAVMAAIALSCSLVAVVNLTFNRSVGASQARELSKVHYQQRKTRGANAVSPANPDQVTSDDITHLSDDIDQTIRTVDQGSGQLQPDDLSDKGLGIN